MKNKSQLMYALDEMLFNKFLVDNYTVNEVETDPETGDYIIEGKLCESLSRDNDGTLALYEDQFDSATETFFKYLDQYIDSRIKKQIN
jgi:hypothetical protein